jgi:hypothetical protein
MRNRTRSNRIITMLLASLTLAGGVTAVAGTSAQASVLCNFEVVSLTSWDLQDGDGTDEIKFKISGDLYGPWDFPDNWVRNASLGNPNKDVLNFATFTLYEQDAVRQTIDSTVVDCAIPGSGSVLLAGNGAIYELGYRIS